MNLDIDDVMLDRLGIALENTVLCCLKHLVSVAPAVGLGYRYSETLRLSENKDYVMV